MSVPSIKCMYIFQIVFNYFILYLLLIILLYNSIINMIHFFLQNTKREIKITLHVYVNMVYIYVSRGDRILYFCIYQLKLNLKNTL